MSHKANSAVILGSGPGLGAAMADAFAHDAYPLSLIARSEEKLASAVVNDAERGIEAQSCAADVGDASSVTRILGLVSQGISDPDVRVYTAAARRPGPVLALSPEALEADFRVCVLGAQAAARRSPSMLAARRGAIRFHGRRVRPLPDAERAIRFHRQGRPQG